MNQRIQIIIKKLIFNKITYHRILLLLMMLLVINNIDSHAQMKMSTDSLTKQMIDHTKTKVEKVPKEKIEEIRNSDDFSYLVAHYKGIQNRSGLERWLIRILEKLFGDKEAVDTLDTLWKIFKYLLISAVIAFVIYVLAKGNLARLFSKNKKIENKDSLEYLDDDIHQDNIYTKLHDAVKNKNYRNAIRLYFLILLKKLDSNDLIKWEMGKTNRDYQRELKSNTILDDFVKLSGIYEYTWYGNFNVSEEKFAKWQSGFNETLNTFE